jgi:hypothetical protein
MTNQARFLNLSNPARPLSTEDPGFGSFLPVDDSAWDDGVRLDGSPKPVILPVLKLLNLDRKPGRGCHNINWIYAQDGTLCQISTGDVFAYASASVNEAYANGK